jgi:hypothetical protein
MPRTSLPNGPLSNFPRTRIRTLSMRVAGTELSPLTRSDKLLLEEIASGTDTLDALAAACRNARVKLVLRTDLEDEGGR